jgi:hypothetical protein
LSADAITTFQGKQPIIAMSLNYQYVINSEANLANSSRLLQKHTKRRKLANLIIIENNRSGD